MRIVLYQCELLNFDKSTMLNCQRKRKWVRSVYELSVLSKEFPYKCKIILKLKVYFKNKINQQFQSVKENDQIKNKSKCYPFG